MTGSVRSLRAVLAVGLLVVLLLAGVASHYASSAPDGLDRVATDTGIGAGAESHPLGDGPLADYSTTGVEHERLSGGVAGVVGVAMTFLLVSAVAVAVRRRDRADAEPARADASAGPGR